MCDIVGCTKKLLNTDEALDDEAIPLEPAIVVSESLDESISESLLYVFWDFWELLDITDSYL